MVRLKNTILLFTTGCMLFLISCGVNAALDNIRFEHLGVAEGLSQESIEVVYQDRQGFLWIGTQEGLNKYDGIGFTHYLYQPQNPNSLTSAWVTSIAEDKDGNLWIGTNKGLNRLNPNNGKITRFFASPESSTLNDIFVTDLYVDSEGDVMVSTRKGLSRFLPASSTFYNYELHDADGIKFHIRDIERLDDELLLLASRSGRIFIYNESENRINLVDEGTPRTFAEVDAPIDALFLDSKERLWIGTSGKGIFYIDVSFVDVSGIIAKNSNPAVPVLLDALDGNPVEDITEDKNGTLWFATQAGLYFYAASGELVHLQHDNSMPESLSSNSVNSLYVDRSNVMWVGTFDELNKWNMATTSFEHIKVTSDVRTSLSGPNITAIGDLNGDTLLIASLTGLDIVDKNTGHVTSLKHDPNNINTPSESQLMSLEVVSENEVWLGYRVKGASRFNPTTMQFTHYQRDPEDPYSLPASGIPDIFKDKNGDIWLATFGGGLSRYNRDTDNFTTYQFDADDKYSLSSNRLMTISQTSDGLLWIGTTDTGLNIFNPQTGSNFRVNEHQNDDGIQINTLIWSIFEDEENNVWVGTQDDGLYLLESENRERAAFIYQIIGQQDGLPSNAIYGILNDKNQNIWVSTNRGLSKINPENMKISNFNSAQGLLTDSFNSGAYAKGANGSFHFGGMGGVTSFDPAEVVPNPNEPPVVITRFQKLNETYNPMGLLEQSTSGAIEIGHKDYLIGFDFAGLDYLAPENNRYRYKLLGLDTEWIEVREAKTATYTNLPAGKYRFQVIAANSDGVWNEEGASIDLIVHPAPWASTFAYAVYSTIIVMLVLLLFRIYMQRRDAEIKYREKLEWEVSERTEELESLNKQLLNASITDQLTGLHNRRYLSEVMPGKAKEVFRKFVDAVETQSATTTDGPRLFIIMFDLDGFKSVNDTFGHDAGDKVIEEVAKRLKKVCRQEDTIIRWGGDEYMIVGKISNAIEAASLAERVRLSIEKHGFDIGSGEKLNLTSSIGFSQYPFSCELPSALTWEHVHSIADHALYKSKQSGRNTWTGLVQSKISVTSEQLVAATKNIDDAIDQQHVAFFENVPDMFDDTNKRVLVRTSQTSE